eukprot:8361989-Pyramimonas_sp.AAC.1
MDLAERIREGEAWKKEYFDDVDRVIRARQEHVHPKDAEGTRRPLTACRTKEKPDVCKHGFMKDHLIHEAPR